ncbi:hypothetical protein L2Z53_11960 (plasmid) [Macrococcoides canis]|uniref:hypothetical protein n=1 Tax=Macrococcoides canis TaxID=1855823 RepID=UPI001F415AC0|nr:hypothetical protein [Macrococcus canis]UJS29050.1 hypothetical protein L2Z53_11960 [Macrococcus canis]
MEVSHDWIQSVTAVLGLILAIVVPYITYKISKNENKISQINNEYNTIKRK